MPSSDQTILTYIIYGHRKVKATYFNVQSTHDEIHEYVRQYYGSHEPNAFYLTFYSAVVAKFIILNQNVLDGDLNPFQLNLSTEPVNFVVLNVIDITDSNFMQDNIGTACEDTSSVCPTDISMTETEPEQDLPVNDNAAYNDVLRKQLSNAILSEDSLGTETDTPLSFGLSVNDNLDRENSRNADGTENQSDSAGVAMNDTDLELRRFSYPQNSFSNQTQRSNHSHLSTEFHETSNTDSNGFYFSRDVKPIQKDIYKSDKYNQTKENKKNGYITRIQGIKTPAQARSSVWPKMRIPRFFRNQQNIHLVVYVVLERLQGGDRVWYTHPDKGFLPKDFTRDTPPCNPIQFLLDRTNVTKDGDFTLDLRMTTLWKKLSTPERLHELDEQTTKRLHRAKHDPVSPRLFCFLGNGPRFCQNTICLSDFIRSPKPSRRHAIDIVVTD